MDIVRGFGIRFLLAQLLAVHLVNCAAQASLETNIDGNPDDSDSFEGASGEEKISAPISESYLGNQIVYGNWTKTDDLGVMTFGGIFWENIPSDISFLLYIAKTNYRGPHGDETVPCYYKRDTKYPQPGRAVINGKATTVGRDELEYLMYDKYYQWYPKKLGEVCPGAVVGGKTSLGNTFICRFFAQNDYSHLNVLLGVMDPRKGKCVVAYDWMDVYESGSYQLLCDSRYNN